MKWNTRDVWNNVLDPYFAWVSKHNVFTAPMMDLTRFQNAVTLKTYRNRMFNYKEFFTVEELRIVRKFDPLALKLNKFHIPASAWIIPGASSGVYLRRKYSGRKSLINK